MSSEDQIIKELKIIKKQLEQQQKIAFRRFHWSISIAFVGLGLGAAIASRGFKGTETTGLSIILLFGGILLMYLTQLQLSQDYLRRTAWSGFGLTVAGLAMVAIPLLSNWGGTIVACFMTIGLWVMPVGLIVMLIAAKPFKKSKA